jgi:hypothetical protein
MPSRSRYTLRGKSGRAIFTVVHVEDECGGWLNERQANGGDETTASEKQTA